MESHQDRRARRLAEIRALNAELERGEAEREARADPQPVVAGRRRGGRLRDTAFVLGIVMLFLVLSGSCITLLRLGGRDFEDAERAGWAVADHCTGHGPLTNKGFGYWERCSVTVRWDDGDADRLVNDAVFTSADIGRDIRVGDHGRNRQSTQLSREDTPQRLWLIWVGGLLGLASVPPGLLAVWLIQASLRFRRR